MSHFTRIKTQLTNLDTVEQALADLGYEVQRGASARGFGGQRARADLVVSAGQYDIGFAQRGGQVEMVADFWGLDIDRNAFLQQLTQRYAYHTVKAQAAEQGWQNVEEVVQPDGSIRLVMQRWE